MGCCCKDSQCGTGKEESSVSVVCPRCGTIGSIVGRNTVKALLKAGCDEQLAGNELRYCASSACVVLYYDSDGNVAEKDLAVTRIGSKETEDPIPLCYCFGYFRDDLEREIRETGTSSIPDQIANEVKARGCSCESRNPSGKCCLGDVTKTFRQLREMILAQDK